jgi:hypothetical protein
MRTFAAATIGAAALACSLFATTPADAATGHQVSSTGGDGSGFSAMTWIPAKAKRIGKIHKFTVPSIKGAGAWGNWYWAKITGQPAFVVLNLNVKDTKSDGLSAGLCYKIKSPVLAWTDRCIVNTKGAGKTYTQHWTMSYWNKDKLEVRTAVGHLVTAENTFYTVREGTWKKLHWA